MSGQTPEGQRAYQVLAWVNEAPATRARDGMRQLAALVRGAETTRGLHEVQDVATVVARLLDTSTPP